jgi:hypothetical protein
LALLAAPRVRIFVSDTAGTTSPPTGEGSSISAARARLDQAVLGFNRHALLVEQYRLAVQRFSQSRQLYEAGAAERETLRQARDAAAGYRGAVRTAVDEFVRRMRDAGLAPEIALIAVKHRLALSVTVTTPAAPSPEAAALESDVSAWAIHAYYDAA